MISDIIRNTLIESWPMLTIFIVTLACVRILYIVDNNEKLVFFEEFMNIMFIIYVLILYRLLTYTEGASAGVNLIPFKEILRHKFNSTLFYYNVIGNIALFVPFGYFVSRHTRAKKAGHLLIATAIVSFTIEATQYKIGRAFDVDDILLNVIGALCGFLLYIALTAIKNHLPKFLQKNAIYNILSIILIVIMILYLSKIFGLGWF